MLCFVVLPLLLFYVFVACVVLLFYVFVACVVFVVIVVVACVHVVVVVCVVVALVSRFAFMFLLLPLMHVLFCWFWLCLLLMWLIS